MLAGRMLASEILNSDPLTSYLLRQILWLLSQPLFWAFLGVVVGPFLFFRGFRLLQRKRLIMDIPRSTIRAAAIGPVEISGKAAGPYTLVSPIGGKECLYYRVIIRAYKKAASYADKTPDENLALLAFAFGFLRQSFKKSREQIIDEGCAPLFVEDGTGELMVYPKGAETQLPSVQSNGGDYLRRVLVRHGFAPDDFEAAEEISILPGDDIFAIGTLSENPWANRKSDHDGDELSRIGPGFVGEDEADLLRREAFPCLDPTLPSGAVSDRKFNLYPSTILTQGQRCPFILSKRSQREVIAKLGWKSLLFIWGGPIWVLWGVWEILGHPEIWQRISSTR